MIPTLETLLRMNGAALIKNGSIYHIEPEAAAIANAPNGGVGIPAKIQPGFQIRVVPLRFVGAKEMQKIVEPLLPPKSVVYADATRNLLVLAGNAEDLTNVHETMRVFDVDFMRGMAVGIYPLHNVDPSTLAGELDALMMTGDKGAMSGMVRILPVERLNSVMAISAQPAYLRDVETWIERLDRFTSTKATNMHVYKVQNVDAMQLAHTLTQIFGQVNNARGGPNASVAPGMTGTALGGTGGGGGAFGGNAQGTSGFGSGANADTPSGQAPGSSSSGGFQSSGTGSGLGGSSTGGSSSGAFGSSSASAGASGSSGLGSSTGGMGASGGFGASSTSGGTGGNTANRQSVAAELGNNARVIADPTNNALVIFAKPADYRDIELVLKELDVMPKQVLVDAMIAEVALTGKLQYGLKWYFQHGDSSLGRGMTSAVIDAATTAAASGGFTYVLAAKAITAQLDLLASENKINILSTPSLMVLNNQEAQINVGDKIPTQTGTVTSTIGGAATTMIQYQETGVTLKIRPRVNAGGLVLMTVQQEILSSPNAGSAPGSTPNLTPTISQRKLLSTVAVHNGDTLALGGLIQETSSDGVTGIPVLSELPYIGWLFGSTLKSLQRNELVMLLTPRTVETRPDVTTVTNEFRRRLTGWSDTRELTPDAVNPSVR